MNFAVFGTKKEALYLAEEIKKHSLGRIEAFVDNDYTKQNTIINKITVISVEQLQEVYGIKIDAVIVAVRGSNSRLAILNQLKGKNILDVGLFKFSYCDYKKEIENLDDCIVWTNKISKPILPYVECNIVDSCNLKCKACSHYSNLCEDNVFTDYEEFCSDLEQLSEKVYVNQLRLLGGEPLLHPDLKKILIESRNILPYADISVVTNGLLIPKIENELFEIMRSNNIGFHISRYIPTNKILNNLIDILDKENVDYLIEGEVVSNFVKSLNIQGDSNPEKALQVCIESGCRFLRKGRIYKCPNEGLIEIFSSKYEYKNTPEKRGVDIYDGNIDWQEQLNEYLYKPIEMCRYCAEKLETIHWEVQTKPQKQDWIVIN